MASNSPHYKDKSNKLGTFNVHELFWMLQLTISTIYCFNPKIQHFCEKLGIAVH